MYKYAPKMALKSRNFSLFHLRCERLAWATSSQIFSLDSQSTLCLSQHLHNQILISHHCLQWWPPSKLSLFVAGPSTTFLFQCWTDFSSIWLLPPYQVKYKKYQLFEGTKFKYKWFQLQSFRKSVVWTDHTALHGTNCLSAKPLYQVSFHI